MLTCEIMAADLMEIGRIEWTAKHGDLMGLNQKTWWFHKHLANKNGSEKWDVPAWGKVSNEIYEWNMME